MSETTSTGGGEPAKVVSKAAKTVLWIDPNLTWESPSMRHLLSSLPHLREAGWSVRAWCVNSDAPRDEVEHVFFTIPRPLRLIGAVIFFLKVNLYGWFLRLRGEPRPATVIHATCGTFLGADAASVHFLSGLWARRWRALGVEGWKEWVLYALNLWGTVAERLQWFSPALRLALPVSDSIGEELRQRIPAGVRIETLPNSYDETRFNVRVRARWRDTQRAALGFKSTDLVFVFVSMGHYKRKGLWLALEALHLLRSTMAGEEKIPRLLVVGGTARTLAGLSVRLGERYQDWREWITLAGMQDEVEKFYAAADAFLFPSYFEAFCLAEIEAAASGLPLLLTPHFGSEMILRDGINGMLLSFEPETMSRQLHRFLNVGLDNFSPGGAGRGLTREGYAGKLRDVYDSLLDREAAADG